jgi:hypothetical protein
MPTAVPPTFKPTQVLFRPSRLRKGDRGGEGTAKALGVELAYYLSRIGKSLGRVGTSFPKWQ